MRTLVSKITTRLMILALPMSCLGQQVPTAKITLQVQDADGVPVADAFIGIGGGLSTPEKGRAPRSLNGTTDNKGLFHAEVASALDQYGAFARAKGYYEGETRDFNVENHKANDWMKRPYQTGRWEPWERTMKITMRPIKNPVPMYVKQLVAFIPELNKPCGYDLEIGDWVSPYGQGKISDFEFKMIGAVKGVHDYTGVLTLYCPGKGNGIQSYDAPPENARSSYRMPYEAPESGYQQAWTWKNGCRLENINNDLVSKYTDESKLHTGFVFRVRSRVDATGGVIEACYGKIQDFIKLSPRLNGQWALDTVYYFNPDKTRNLEYDSKRNLFPATKDRREFSP